MSSKILLVLVVVALLGYLLYTRVDHFFYGNNSITINWGQVAGVASYNWKVCNTTSCDPDPDNWPGPSQNSTTNSIVLNSTNCGTCDFGSSIQFAVQSVGANGLNSSWTTTTLDLNSYLSVKQQRIVNSMTNPTPPKAGDNSSLYQIVFTQPIPLGVYETNLAYVTLTRGGMSYHYKSPVPYTPSANSLYLASTTIDYTSSFWDNPIPGGALQSGDIIAVASMLANIGVQGPTWPPPNSKGPVYYYGTYQVTTQSPPSAPGSLTYTL